jgi:hypothetical protein
MTQTHLLSVEIKTIDSQSNHLDVPSNLVIFCDPQGNCFIAQGLDQIKAAIIGAIPHLGTNSRHPLLFNVQILPGDHADALIFSIEREKNQLPGRRLRYAKRYPLGQTRNN